MGLIRELLLNAASEKGRHHYQLMQEAGLTYIGSLGITELGREFINAVSDDDIWARTLKAIGDIGAPFDVYLSVAKALTRATSRSSSTMPRNWITGLGDEGWKVEVLRTCR